MCTEAGLDPATVAQLADDVAWHDQRSIATARHLLGLLAEQIHRDSPRNDESLSNLTANLSQTYEVLNLIYRVGDKLDRRQNPDDFFERTFAEVIAVLQVDSLAAVTHVSPGTGAPGVVVVGKGQTHRRQICAIANGLSKVMPERRMIILDRSMIQRFLPEETWLSNLVAVRLLRQGEPAGILLAVNKANGKDFDDLDLQMLQVVADRSAIYLEDLHVLADLQELLIALLRSLVSSIDAKDPYTSGHGERVALISRRIAEQMDYGASFCQKAYFGGLLHDIGKITVPGELLRKPSSLTDEELRLIRRHPINGARIIQGMEAMKDIVPAVLGHHERVDGKGYPNRTPGSRLCALARIVAVADCFDAMTTRRAYRPARSIDAVRDELTRIAGTHLDATMVDALLSIDLDSLLADLGTYHSGLRTVTTRASVLTT